MVGALATYLMYAMLGVPFLVWTGRGAFAVARERKGYPGHARSFWLAGAPALLILYGLLRGFDASPGTGRDEWGETLFLMMPPAGGMILGYVLGWLCGARRA